MTIRKPRRRKNLPERDRGNSKTGRGKADDEEEGKHVALIVFVMDGHLLVVYRPTVSHVEVDRCSLVTLFT